jgi:tripartite-type tricarboxylate transporter receptor subunit TctC
MTALLGGQVAMFFAPVPIAIPHMQSGRVRALATTAARRASSMPNLPTMSEGGLPGFEFSTWEGLFVPAGTPGPVIAKLNSDTNRILETPDIRDKFSDIGAGIAGGTPEQLAAHMKVDAEKWARSLKKSGMRIE